MIMELQETVEAASGHAKDTLTGRKSSEEQRKVLEAMVESYKCLMTYAEAESGRDRDGRTKGMVPEH